jgi:hypothetical protein
VGHSADNHLNHINMRLTRLDASCTFVQLLLNKEPEMSVQPSAACSLGAGNQPASWTEIFEEIFFCFQATLPIGCSSNTTESQSALAD